MNREREACAAEYAETAELLTRAVHRPKPGQNLVIRAGFKKKCVRRGVTGYLFLHRGPARVQAVQKKISRIFKAFPKTERALKRHNRFR